MKPRPLQRVNVCPECLRACCWQGVFVCGSKTTEPKSMAYADLDEDGREHPDFWTRDWVEMNAPTTRKRAS